MTVEVRPGRVMVESTVDAGNWDVMVCVTAGIVMVDKTVLAGSCVV